MFVDSRKVVVPELVQVGVMVVEEEEEEEKEKRRKRGRGGEGEQGEGGERRKEFMNEASFTNTRK